MVLRGGESGEEVGALGADRTTQKRSLEADEAKSPASIARREDVHGEGTKEGEMPPPPSPMAQRLRQRAGPKCSKAGTSQEALKDRPRSLTPGSSRRSSRRSDSERELEEEENLQDVMSCGSDEESDGDASVVSASSNVSRATYPKEVGREALKLLDPNRRGRGRPATTGEYVGILKVKEDKLRLDREADEQRLVSLVTDSIQSAVVVLRDVGGVAGAPVAKLVTSAEEAIESIRRVGTVSRGLKGTLQKRLKVASALLQEVVGELSARAEAGATSGGSGSGQTVAVGPEVEALRTRAAKAEEEAERLREEIASLRATTVPRAVVCPPVSRSPSPPLTRGRKRRRRSAGKTSDGAEKGGEEEEVEMRMSPLPPSSPPSRHEGHSARMLEGHRGPETSGVMGAAGLEDLFLRLAVMIDAKLDGRLEELRRELLPAKKLAPNRPPLRHERSGEKREQHPPPQQPPSVGTRRKKKTEGGETVPAQRVAEKEAPMPASGQQQQRHPPTVPAKKEERRAPAPAPSKKGQRQRSQAPAPAPSLVHPPPPVETWATVTRRGKAKKKEDAPPPRPLPAQKAVPAKSGVKEGREERRRSNGPARPVPPPSKGKGAAPPKARKLPRTAAVIITCREGEYEKVVREAQSKIDLASLNIPGLRMRRTLTGALAYEVAGENGGERADALASRLRGLFGERSGVDITRPTKLAEMRILGLDITVRPGDVAAAVAAAGSCEASEVKVGPIKPGPTGAGTVWIRCPLTAARKVVASGGRIRVGWAWARATILEDRPLQCFRCMEGGHVRAQCRSEIERTGRCYRCGEPGHLAQSCPAQQAACAVCKDKGRPANHRAGGKACPESRRRCARPGVTGGSGGAPGPRPGASKEKRGREEAHPPSPAPDKSSSDPNRGMEGEKAGAKEGRDSSSSPSRSPKASAKKRRRSNADGAKTGVPPAEPRAEDAEALAP